MDIVSLLKLAKSRNASDLHMVVSQPPLLRIDGSLGPIEGMQPLTDADIRDLIKTIHSDLKIDTTPKYHEDSGYIMAIFFMGVHYLFQQAILKFLEI